MQVTNLKWGGVSGGSAAQFFFYIHYFLAKIFAIKNIYIYILKGKLFLATKSLNNHYFCPNDWSFSCIVLDILTVVLYFFFLINSSFFFHYYCSFGTLSFFQDLKAWFSKLMGWLILFESLRGGIKWQNHSRRNSWN